MQDTKHPIGFCLYQEARGLTNQLSLFCLGAMLWPARSFDIDADTFSSSASDKSMHYLLLQIKMDNFYMTSYKWPSSKLPKVYVLSCLLFDRNVKCG